MRTNDKPKLDPAEGARLHAELLELGYHAHQVEALLKTLAKADPATRGKMMAVARTEATVRASRLTQLTDARQARLNLRKKK